ncbi:ABC transporter permease [Terrimonas sp.]|uniref:ABC transporter permease n=1 Tax=Terrimonas sp. TaxID=1914338 RepID=UPI000D51BABB|nr:ABC transporter permease [Terrimonas sp.]PVD50876.1 ABC transporter permease [Terrimonas sp.]
MSKSYSQFKAMLAITKAALIAIFRSPSAVVFSFAFPLVFILVFGFLGGSGGVSLRAAFTPDADTSSQLYRIINTIPGIKIVEKSPEEITEDLEKGRLTATISIQKNNKTASPAYFVNLTSSEAVNPQNIQVLKSILGSIITNMDKQQFPDQPTVAAINNNIEKIPGRTYRTIDFILPGQLGFSLLSAGVFGVAFLFFNLRQTLVLKRFFATPISRTHIVLGEGLSRVIFQLITAVVILLIGHYFFHFTLVHGWLTFVELLVLSFIGLMVFMSFGFVVSGLAKNESSIPPLANIVTMPQFLLSGTFFPIDNFPTWLQPLCKILPLTHLNDAMRNIAFEGIHLTACGKQLGILAIWAVIGYSLAVKLFKWE